MQYKEQKQMAQVNNANLFSHLMQNADKLEIKYRMYENRSFHVIDECRWLFSI